MGVATASIFALALSIAAPMAALAASADNVAGTFWVKPSAGLTGTINFQNQNGGWGGTKIYDNGNAHFGTDDNLFLDAPSSTVLSGGLIVQGGVVFTQGALNASGITGGTPAIVARHGTRSRTR